VPQTTEVPLDHAHI